MNTQMRNAAALALLTGIAAATATAEPATAPKAEFHAFSTSGKSVGAKLRGTGVMPAPIEYRINAYTDALGQTHLQCEPHDNPEHIEYVRRRRAEQEQ